jgi:hypothetical protein
VFDLAFATTAAGTAAAGTTILPFADLATNPNVSLNLAGTTYTAPANGIYQTYVQSLTLTASAGGSAGTVTLNVLYNGAALTGTSSVISPSGTATLAPVNTATSGSHSLLAGQTIQIQLVLTGPTSVTYPAGVSLSIVAIT